MSSFRFVSRFPSRLQLCLENMASGDSSKKRRSIVWEHFDEIAPAKVRCVHCSMELSYSGRSTSTVLNHMRTKHSDSQPQQAATMTRRRKIDNSLVDLLVELGWRLSAVNGEGFRRTVNTFDPTYVIPSRKELKTLRDARHEKPERKHPTWDSSSDSE